MGKSTLALQLAGMIADAPGHDGGPGGLHVAYVSGEESAAQLRDRAARLGVGSPTLSVLNASSLDAVLEQLGAAAARGARCAAVVIDSIQAMALDAVDAGAGSPSQVRECAVRLLQFAKAHATTVVLIGHVTKSNELAGPRMLEHLVDCVLYMDGEVSYSHRLLRCTKNRFGSTSEVREPRARARRDTAAVASCRSQCWR